MTLYVSKPVTVEAVHWTGDNWLDVAEFAGVKASFTQQGDALSDLLLIAGKDGAQKQVPVPVGHWLICNPGDKSDIWPCDDDVFHRRYEEQA